MLLDCYEAFMDTQVNHSHTGIERRGSAAVKHLLNSVQLQITEIIRDNGSVLCGRDEVVQGKLSDQAVLVKAKDCVTTEHLDSVVKVGAQQATPQQVKLDTGEAVQ